jgi:hypothetical protein
VGRYQARLEHRGALLGRIVDIGAELFAIAAACTYAVTLAAENPAQRDAIYELADLFCRQARRRAKTLLHQLWANDDDAQYRVAQSVLDGRYAFLQRDIADPAAGASQPVPASSGRVGSGRVGSGRVGSGRGGVIRALSAARS